MNPQPKAVIVQPGAGKNLNFGEENIASVMLSGEQTGGRLAVIYNTEAPDSGPPLHVHANEDELFLVVEGHYSFYADGRWTEVDAGGVVYLPKGTAHRYRNIGTTTGRIWILTSPSGFERFFARYADELAKADGPDMGRIVEIHREHGIELIKET